MLLVTIIGNILNRLYLPGDVLVSVEGFRFEIVSPELFVLSMVGVAGRYLCDISQVSGSLPQCCSPILKRGQEVPPASLAG
jgi:hypothetical protein